MHGISRMNMRIYVQADLTEFCPGAVCGGGKRLRRIGRVIASWSAVVRRYLCGFPLRTTDYEQVHEGTSINMGGCV